MRPLTLCFGADGIGFEDKSNQLAEHDAYEISLPRVGHGEIGRLVIERVLKTTTFELTGLRQADDPALFSVIHWQGVLWRLEEGHEAAKSFLSLGVALHGIR